MARYFISIAYSIVLVGICPVFADYVESACKATISGSEWEPFRIKLEFVGEKIQSSWGERLRKHLMPTVAEYLTQALTVRDRVGEFQLKRTCKEEKFGLCTLADDEPYMCSSVIPEKFVRGLDIHSCSSSAAGPEDCHVSKHYPGGSAYFSSKADLVLFVSADPDAYCQTGTLGYATTCSISTCGRANIGHVQICDVSSSISDEKWVNIILHEMLHVLGFSVSRFRFWINPDGSPQMPAKDAFVLTYAVEKESHGNKIIKVLPSIPAFPSSGQEIKVQYVPYNIVKSIDARDFGKSSTCNCPLDPSTPFTDSSLTKCMLEDGGLEDCVFVVASPAVVRQAKSYYNCDSLVGMELENHMGPAMQYTGNTMFNSHWKYNNIQNELMNGRTDLRGPTMFLSPMTLALLEDSGFYRVVNYEKAATRIFKHVMHGYQAGCGLLTEPFKEELVRVDDLGACSPDTLWKTFGLERKAANNEPIYSPYQACAEYMGSVEDEKNGLTSYNYAIRCLMVDFDDIHRSATASCDNRITCGFKGEKSGPKFYSVYSVTDVLLGECLAPGQRLTNSAAALGGSIICADPEIVCADLFYPHVPFSFINKVGAKSPAANETTVKKTDHQTTTTTTTTKAVPVGSSAIIFIAGLLQAAILLL